MTNRMSACRPGGLGPSRGLVASCTPFVSVTRARATGQGSRSGGPHYTKGVQYRRWAVGHSPRCDWRKGASRVSIPCSFDDRGVTRAQLADRAQTLSRLFKYEFQFRADAPSETIYAETLEAI